MLKQSDIDIEKVQRAIESLKAMAANDDYSCRLLVLGMDNIADVSMSNDEEIIQIRKDVNRLILED